MKDVKWKNKLNIKNKGQILLYIIFVCSLVVKSTGFILYSPCCATSTVRVRYQYEWRPSRRRCTIGA